MRVASFELGTQRLMVVSRPYGVDPSTLSPAEQEVARFMVAGMTNAEIAAARGTSVRTVANQARAIFAKLGVSGRREIAQALLGRP